MSVTWMPALKKTYADLTPIYDQILLFYRLNDRMNHVLSSHQYNTHMNHATLRVNWSRYQGFLARNDATAMLQDDPQGLLTQRDHAKRHRHIISNILLTKHIDRKSGTRTSTGPKPPGQYSYGRPVKSYAGQFNTFTRALHRKIAVNLRVLPLI